MKDEMGATMLVMGFVLWVRVSPPQTPKIAPLRGSSSPFPTGSPLNPSWVSPILRPPKIAPLRGSPSPFSHWESSERLTGVLPPQTPKTDPLGGFPSPSPHGGP